MEPERDDLMLPNQQKLESEFEPGQSRESLLTTDTNCLLDETVGTKRKVLPRGCGLGSLSSGLLSFMIFSNFNLTGPQGAGIPGSLGKATAGTTVGRD